MKKMVILLNGPSSSGKSTLAGELSSLIKKRHGLDYPVISIDDHMKLPADETIYEDDVWEIEPDIRNAVCSALERADGAVTDHVITSARIYEDLMQLEDTAPVLKVRVTCPLDVLLAREKSRGDRAAGSAQASYEYLYPQEGYDLTVDTSVMPAEECAEIILTEAEKKTGTSGEGRTISMATKKVKVYRYDMKPEKTGRRAVSILLKALLVILAVILVAAAGFWFKCRVMDGRSFMAGFVDLFLTLQHRSDKFTYAEEADRYVEQMRQTNSEPVVTGKAKFGVSLREESLEALQAFIYNDQEHPAQTVFYFHGGGYVNQPNAQQLTMAARTAAETGCEVVLMVYPKMPVYDCEYAYDLCTRFYLDYIDANDCGKTVFMGDSAGGGLALGLAETLRDSDERMPEELILISPWVDLTMSNPDMTGYTAHDPMLGIDGARRMGEIWAGDLALDDPRVSPLYGDLSGLPPVTLTAGTWEVFYPDEALLHEGLVKAGNSCRFIVGEKMIHCYPIIPVPEAKPAQAEIWEAITR